MYRIVYPFDPDNLDAKHSPFVEDLIQMRRDDQHEALLEIGKMIAALKSLGLQCGFTKKLHGTPLYELKTHSRGGQKGGARAYLFRAPNDIFMVCHAECKAGNDANPHLLEDTAYILESFEENRAVFPPWMKGAFYYDSN